MMLFGNDITMCQAKNCDRKEQCYRYKATPEQLQSYAMFEPVCFEDKSYKYYYAMDVGNLDEYEQGSWDMFIRITNAYFGKQYYFMQDNGTVYSRYSGTYVTKEDAIEEFIYDICCEE